MTISNSSLSAIQMTIVNKLLKRIPPGLLILTAMLLISSLIIVTANEPVAEIREEKTWPVSTINAHPMHLSPTLALFGKVESGQIANLKTSVSARVDELLASEGDFMKQGELLVRLDQSELQLTVSMAESEVKRQTALLAAVETEQKLAESITQYQKELSDISRKKLKRHLDLYRQGMIADSLLDTVREGASESAMTLQRHLAQIANFPNKIAQQEAQVADALARLERARLDLDQSLIRMPFTGRVTRTLVAPGDRVLPGTVIVSVANQQELEVRTSIPGESIRALRDQIDRGIKVFATGTIDKQVYPFHLDRLSADVRPGQTGLDAFFRSPNAQQLDMGRVVQLRVEMPTEPGVVAIPMQALYENNRIYRVEDRRLVGVDVEAVGDFVQEDGSFQILVRSPELAMGDQIITTQLPRAMNGLLVSPVTLPDLVSATP